jgi:hypothetical protein
LPPANTFATNLDEDSLVKNKIIVSKVPNYNSSSSFKVISTSVTKIYFMFACKSQPQRLPFFAHHAFLQSPSTSPVLPSYVKAQASVMADMQSLPSIVVSSLSYDPHVFAFIDIKVEVSSS